MSREILCDRCRKIIRFSDDAYIDMLQREYKNQDICPDCDLQIQLASTLCKEDMISNQPTGTALKKMLEMYKIEVKEND